MSRASIQAAWEDSLGGARMVVQLGHTQTPGPWEVWAVGGRETVGGQNLLAAVGTENMQFQLRSLL